MVSNLVPASQDLLLADEFILDERIRSVNINGDTFWSILDILGKNGSANPTTDWRRIHRKLLHINADLSGLTKHVFTGSDNRNKKATPVVNLISLRSWRAEGVKIVNRPHKLFKNGVVYLLHFEGIPKYYKIGTAEDLATRLRSIDQATPFKIVVDHVIETSKRLTLEKYLHNRFERKRFKGEWFLLSKRDVDFIKTISAKTASGILDGMEIQVEAPDNDDDLRGLPNVPKPEEW